MQLTESAHRGEPLPLEEVPDLPLTVDRTGERLERSRHAERRERFLRDEAIDPHRHRQRPRGDVVEVGVGRFRLRFEERARETTARLIELDREGARGELGDFVRFAVVVAKPLGDHLLREGLHFDALGLKQTDQLLEASPRLRREEELQDVAGAAAGDGIGAEAMEIALQTILLLHRGEKSRHARDMVVVQPIGESQKGTVATAIDDPRARTPPLLIGHSHRPDEARPRVAVRRIEEIEVLAGVVGPAEAIEGARIRAADRRRPVEGNRRDVFVDRIGRREEEVGRLRRHLMEVDVDQRPPLDVLGDPRLGLRLALPRPVAVQIEEEVVRPPSRPRLAMLAALWVGVAIFRAHRPKPALIAIAPVRVQTGIENHEGLLANLCARRIGTVDQLIGGPERSLRGGRFVAVHVVAHPEDRGEACEQRIERLVALTPTRIGELSLKVANLIETTEDLGGSDEAENELPPFGSHTIGNNPNPIALLFEGAQVREHFDVRGEPSAERNSVELIRRRYGAGELIPRHERKAVFIRRDRRREQRYREDQQQDPEGRTRHRDPSRSNGPPARGLLPRRRRGSGAVLNIGRFLRSVRDSAGRS